MHFVADEVLLNRLALGRCANQHAYVLINIWIVKRAFEECKCLLGYLVLLDDVKLSLAHQIVLDNLCSIGWLVGE